MPVKDIERMECRNAALRAVPSTKEEREAGAGEQVLEGYAVVFDSLSVPLWGFREIIAPGAFTNNLKTDPDVRALVDHDPSKLLGRTVSETLSLEQDKTGLKMRVIVPDTQLGADTITLVNRGDLSQMSFAFTTVNDKWETKNGEDLRTVLEAELWDVSIVTYPAYEETSVSLASRSMLAGEGFDFQAVVRAMQRVRRGLPVTNEDLQTISDLRGGLSNLGTRIVANNHAIEVDISQQVKKASAECSDEQQKRAADTLDAPLPGKPRLHSARKMMLEAVSRRLKSSRPPAGIWHR